MTDCVWHWQKIAMCHTSWHTQTAWQQQLHVQFSSVQDGIYALRKAHMHSIFLTFWFDTEKALFQVILGLLLVYADWEKGGACLRVCMYVWFMTYWDMFFVVWSNDSFNFSLGLIKYIVIVVINPSLRSFPNVAFETVPMFIWLMMTLSRPFKEDRLALPLSMPLSSRWSVVWCPCPQVVSQASQHFRSSEKQATSEGCIRS